MVKIYFYLSDSGIFSEIESTNLSSNIEFEKSEQNNYITKYNELKDDERENLEDAKPQEQTYDIEEDQIKDFFIENHIKDNIKKDHIQDNIKNTIYSIFITHNQLRREKCQKINEKLIYQNFFIDEQELELIHQKYFNQIKKDDNQNQQSYKYYGVSFIYVIVFTLNDIVKTVDGDDKKKLLEDSMKINFGNTFDLDRVLFCKIGYSETILERIQSHIGKKIDKKSKKNNESNKKDKNNQEEDYGTFGGKIYRLYKCTNQTVEKRIHASTDQIFQYLHIKDISPKKYKFDGKNEIYIFNEYLMDQLDKNKDCLYLETDKNQFDKCIQYQNQQHKKQMEKCEENKELIDIYKKEIQQLKDINNKQQEEIKQQIDIYKKEIQQLKDINNKQQEEIKYYQKIIAQQELPNYTSK
ncbi:hypothetical protein ABPG74_014194 [Tetrahymena malaccensis]